MVEPSPPDWGRPTGSATPGPAAFPPAPPSNGSATPAERVSFADSPPPEAESERSYHARPDGAGSPEPAQTPALAYEGEFELRDAGPPPPTWAPSAYRAQPSLNGAPVPSHNGFAYEGESELFGSAPASESSSRYSPYAGGMYAGAYGQQAAAREAAVAAPSAVGGFWPWGLRGMAETLEVLALALVMFLLVRSVAQNFIVEGGSMEPTLHSGEMLIVNKLSYRSFDLSWIPGVDKHDWRPFGSPQAGDVVVFRFPQDQTRDFIKRVIGLPGQTIEISGGVLKVDGVVRDEPFLAQPAEYRYGPEKVPEGYLFVLGDNRNNSYDSHSWGMLQQSLLIGRAELRYWPFSRFGRVEHTDPPEVPTKVTQSLSTPR